MSSMEWLRNLAGPRPLVAEFLRYAVETSPGASPGQPDERLLDTYRAQPRAFLDDLDYELGVVVDVERRSLTACLEDLTLFNNLPEHTDNDGWYARREAFVSMHLDFLMLGFSRRRLDGLRAYAEVAANHAAARFCDVGAGCGRFGALLLRNQPGWHGAFVDKYAAASSYARGYLSEVGLADRARLATADIADMPFEDGAFDLVFAAEVLEHVDDADLATAELVRVTRPGGWLAVSIPIDLDIAMHPVVFESPEAVVEHFVRHGLLPISGDLVEVAPTDAVAAALPEFVGCYGGLFRRPPS